jgi:cell wall-associated NlpC family hydrolase
MDDDDENLDLEPEELPLEPWREAIIAQAKLWLKTPYHHNAEVLGGGVDCGHLLKACYVGAGLIDDFDLGKYPHDWMIHRSEEIFLGHVTTYLDPVDLPLPGDVVVWRHGRCFSHGAIVVRWPSRVIHAIARQGQVAWGDGTQGWLRTHVRLFYSIAGRLK